MKIIPATLEDVESLANMFLGHIDAHREYISHGELQMGVGVGQIVDGTLEAAPAPDAREKWLKYIVPHIEEESFAEVWKAVSDDGNVLLGFCVADIENDGDAPFGMVCDILTREDCQGQGVGSALLETAIAWLRSRGIQDIYLESGKNNHAAHKFFERRGFAHLSEIYKLK